MKIILGFTPFSSMTVKRMWFYHHWKPEPLYSHGALKSAVPLESSWFAFDHHYVRRASCFRILGLNVALVFQGKELTEQK